MIHSYNFAVSQLITQVIVSLKVCFQDKVFFYTEGYFELIKFGIFVFFPYYFPFLARRDSSSYGSLVTRVNDFPLGCSVRADTLMFIFECQMQ